MKKLLPVIITMVLAGLMSEPLYAAPAFDELDVNKDSFISKDEAKKMEGLPRVFAVMDKNEDGKLSRKEYNFLHPELQKAGSEKAPNKK